mgnify:CR=1 FL=1
MVETKTRGYLHGFTQGEQRRLYHQARFMEHRVHDRLPFQRTRRLLEVGCGVGAQTEILLRYFPELHVTGLDAAEPNLEQARAFLSALPCWILEHVANPALVLSEVRRVLRSGAPVVVTEVQNATFFLDPYSPNTLAYWTAFNDHQLALGGDPFVGAKLGNLLLRNGYRDIQTEVKTVHLDNRTPGERAEFLAYWTDLLLSGAPSLLQAGKVAGDVVEGMKAELAEVAHHPDAVFWYSFVQARARV